MRNFIPILFLWLPLVAHGDPFAGQRDVVLLDQAGTRHIVAKIEFENMPDSYSYKLAWNEEAFSDHFLSMRPFRCLEGVKKLWCRVPYPYENRREITPESLTDLEYDLLFVWKGATDYGINLWNGVYYRLTITGDRLLGSMHEMDMNLLAAPPEQGNLRPIKTQDLHEAEADSHWLPELVIE